MTLRSILLLALVALCITVLDCIALCKGIDGKALAGALACLFGIAGFVSGRITRRQRRD